MSQVHVVLVDRDSRASQAHMVCPVASRTIWRFRHDEHRSKGYIKAPGGSDWRAEPHFVRMCKTEVTIPARPSSTSRCRRTLMAADGAGPAAAAHGLQPAQERLAPSVRSRVQALSEAERLRPRHGHGKRAGSDSPSERN